MGVALGPMVNVTSVVVSTIVAFDLSLEVVDKSVAFVPIESLLGSVASHPYAQ